MWDLSLPYYQYCENAVGFFTQPFNTLSALGYLVVALWLAFRRSERDAEFYQVTAVLLFLVGGSSMYWHFADRPLGLTFDIVFALLLASELCTVICSRLLRFPLWSCVFLTIIMFIGCMALMDTGLPFLTQNGGAFIPPLFLLAIASLVIQNRNQDGAVYLLSAAYALVFAVMFRSVDMVVCTTFPTGTHFLSHIFAAISVYYVVRAVDTAETLGDEGKKTEKPKNFLDNDIL